MNTFLFGIAIYLISLGYAVWQGPLHGKWAEAAFWVGLSISVELGLSRKEHRK